MILRQSRGGAPIHVTRRPGDGFKIQQKNSLLLLSATEAAELARLITQGADSE